jgi:hypothetical protein
VGLSSRLLGRRASASKIPFWYEHDCLDAVTEVELVEE